MIKIGLSGNRFSGKDRIADLFKFYSIPIFDADLVLKFMFNCDYEFLGKIREQSGADYFRINDKLDPVRISYDNVFDGMLDMIEKKLFLAYEKFQKDNFEAVYTIFKSNLLFERGWYGEMDLNIIVDAPLLIRYNRGLKKTDLSVRQLELLIDKESNSNVKGALADYVIDNYSDANVEKKILEIDQEIINRFILEDIP